MPNLAVAIRQEILRLARKEVRASQQPTRQAVAQYRREIAALKRRLSAAEKKLAFLASKESERLAQPARDEEEITKVRFSPKSVRAHRKRLGLSAEDYARLLGVSMQTVYHWEQGKSRPRQTQLAALAGVRKLGRREAHRQLEILSEHH